MVKGTGTSPTNSTIDFWFNPDLTNLGAADGSIFTSKVGREGAGNAISSVTLGGGNLQGGNFIWDEVTVAESLSDFVVPEPSTYALLTGFVALGGVLLRRRIRR